MKQVLIVDDDTLVREYLSKSAYDLFGDSEVFTTSTMTGALSICAHSQPSTILLDLNLPDTTGLDGLIALRALCPISCIIMISGSIPNEKLMEKIREEANGFLTKSNHHLSQLANMISEIEAGEEIFETTRPPFGLISRSYSGLSPIENQCLEMFRNGMTVRDVIKQTGKSDSYVKSVRRSIKEKLGPDVFGS
tara:strand:- start:11326 stop:11904 length:579 start_codon:yes stop_codon:yes gene_type:complete